MWIAGTADNKVDYRTCLGFLIRALIALANCHIAAGDTDNAAIACLRCIEVSDQKFVAGFTEPLSLMGRIRSLQVLTGHIWQDFLLYFFWIMPWNIFQLQHEEAAEYFKKAHKIVSGDPSSSKSDKLKVTLDMVNAVKLCETLRTETGISVWWIIRNP